MAECRLTIHRAANRCSELPVDPILRKRRNLQELPAHTEDEDRDLRCVPTDSHHWSTSVRDFGTQVSDAEPERRHAALRMGVQKGRSGAAAQALTGC